MVLDIYNFNGYLSLCLKQITKELKFPYSYCNKLFPWMFALG